MKTLLLSMLLLIVLLCACSLQAAPLRLSKSSDAGQVQFSYRFDALGQAQQLHFTLQQAALNDTLRNFRPFSARQLQQYLWRDLQQHIASHPQVRLQRHPDKRQLKFKVITRDVTLRQQLETELRQLLLEQRQFYLQQQYYTELQQPTGELAIVPDHARLMQASLNALLPVATAWHAKLVNLPTRLSLQLLTSWVQQIPYQDLSDRRHSDGNDFSPPLKLLRQNRGDCDSKAILLAALLRLLMPEVRLAIIYLPGHAILAVQLTPADNDKTITLEGRPYILVDATGPAELAPGEVAQQYEIFTQNGSFSYQSL